MNNKFELPSYVVDILNSLEQHGFEAYVVGGSVRDIIMGNSPHDYDITTSALPEQVIDIFSESHRVIETGIKHGTVTVICEKNPVEITTYRIDGNYLDSRRPESVTFTRSLKDDLSRRDFTVNALAYNPSVGIIDYFDGIGDIGKKTIRCIGNPETRFTEDALRILRALRFSVKLNFDINKATSDAILKLRETLCTISAERIQSELFTMFSYGNTSRLSLILLEYKSIVETILQVNVDSDTYTSACKEITSIKSDTFLSLIYFIGKISGTNEILKKNLQKLKVSNDFSERTSAVFEILTISRNISNKADVKLLMRDYGVGYCIDAAVISDALNITDGMGKVIKHIVSENECYSLRQLSVTGDDLINKFSIKGKVVGEILNELLLCVITGNCENEQLVLIDKAKQILNTAET